MKLKCFDSKKINTENFNEQSVVSGRRIWEDVKVDYVSSRHIAFTVVDEKYSSIHSVIYFGEREFPNSWNCDCRWFSIKGTFCKHILGVHLKINFSDEFLEDIETEFLDPIHFDKSDLKEVNEEGE